MRFSLLCCWSTVVLYFQFVKSTGLLNIEELQDMRYALDILHRPINQAELDSSEGLQLASKHGQKYFCKLPSKALEMEQQHNIEDKLPLDYPIVKLLEPMRFKPCLKIVKGWWTYEFCFMSSLRQYHSEDGKPSGNIISLGEHESDFDWSDDQKVKAKMFKKKRVQKYHTQYYVNGTQCQVINHKRDTEVRYYCDESAVTPYIERVDEPSTCSYIITIKTNLICSHPHTKLTSKLKPVEILCQPVLSPQNFQNYVDQKAKAELEAFDQANLLLKEKRDRLRQVLNNLKAESQSFEKTANPASVDSASENKKEASTEQVAEDASTLDEHQAEQDIRDIAIGFILRFVSEDSFTSLNVHSQTDLLKKTMQLITKYQETLPSADLARLIRFEVKSYIEQRQFFTNDYVMNMLKGISPVSTHHEEVKKTSLGSIRIKVRQLDTDFTDEDEMEQDPSVRELEKEIESELREAGLNSKHDLEVHLITRNKDGDALSDIDASQFKEALMLLMGGGSLEDREKEKFNRLLDNYNLLFKDADSQFVISSNENDDESKHNS